MVINCPHEIVPDLAGIIVLSHGPLSGALVESAKLIIGDSPNIASLSLDYQDDPCEFRAEFLKIYPKFPEGTLFLVDINGGTPLNQLLFAIQQEKKEILALSGANLSMLLEAIFARNMVSGKELLRQMESIGKDAVINVTELAARNFSMK